MSFWFYFGASQCVCHLHQTLDIQLLFSIILGTKMYLNFFVSLSSLVLVHFNEIISYSLRSKPLTVEASLLFYLVQKSRNLLF